MPLRYLKKTKSILLVTLVSLFMLGIFPKQVQGGIGYEIAGDSNGLVITSSNYIDMGNLNPGDKKHSTLKLKNTGSQLLIIYMRTKIASEEAPNNGYLGTILLLTIKDGHTVITDKTFRAAHNEGNIKIGPMAPGAEKTLDYYVHLPGELTGNQYQAASMRVRWIFTTMSPSKSSNDSDNPSGPGTMPKTGEISSLYFYGFGALLIVSGLALRKKGL